LSRTPATSAAATTTRDTALDRRPKNAEATIPTYELAEQRAMHGLLESSEKIQVLTCDDERIVAEQEEEDNAEKD
jgi:hypothetical protein